MTFGFWDSFGLHGIGSKKNYSYVGKDNIRGKPMRFWIRNTDFPCKFAGLRFADWDSKKICGLAD